jgi:hypothetical protein
MTLSVKKVPPENKKDAGILRQNYKEMDETGKEKLKQVASQILEIYKTVNEEHNKKFKKE